VAVAILALAALVGGGFIWVRATPRLAGTATGQDTVAPPDQTLPRAAPDTSATASASDQVAVHVAGRVRRPGLVRLPADSRVHDAIRAAGGVTAGADLNAVNLARKLTDGEQVRIPIHGDPVPPPAAAADPTPSGPIDLNTATVDQLDALPGVGEVTVGRIVAYRSAHPFTTVDELLEVPGIGQRRFDQLKDLVTVA
ncbi:MAG TPA: ComEA family DNA-binding protein, partial [Actinomycetota bacterium]|nr:ComEA family DNA-binding protein [Actinomycetota bacterium]